MMKITIISFYLFIYHIHNILTIPLLNTKIVEENHIKDIFHENRSTRTKKNAISYKEYLWDDGLIPYQFCSKLDLDERRKIFLAMDNIELHTCVVFVPYKSEKQFLYITNEGPGCWANVGVSLNRLNKLNLNSNGCFGRRGIVEHELLHVLGLYHEQSQNDRDQYISICWHNIIKSKRYNFEKQTYATTFDIPYDVNSVMHYSNFAFTNNRRPTIFSKIDRKTIIGQREGATNLDFQKICLMYGCTRVPRSPSTERKGKIPYEPKPDIDLKEYWSND